MAKLIMVIDECPDLLALLEELLMEAGYRVRVHPYRTQDLDTVRRARPDLIISDYVAREEAQSWQFLQQLTWDRATAAIPLIICTTSSAVVREHESWLRAKGVCVVHKPFNVDELLQAVDLQIGTPALDEATPAGETDGA